MTNFLEERKINREYKNDLFVFLFGTNKEFALSLYNAMNNSNYTDPDSITLILLKILSISEGRMTYHF